MKLQINSLEALERLIGGDSDIELEIRGNIVQEFTKRHLKPLANTDALDDVKRSISRAAEDKVTELFGSFKKDGWKTQFYLNGEIKKEVQDAASKHVEGLINKYVKEACDKWTDETVKRLIDQKVKAYIEYEIKAGVTARLEEIKKGLV